MQEKVPPIPSQKPEVVNYKKVFNFKNVALTVAFSVGLVTGNLDRIVDYVFPSFDERFVSEEEFIEYTTPIVESIEALSEQIQNLKNRINVVNPVQEPNK